MDKAWRGFVWATHDAAQEAFGKVPTGSAPKASTNPRVASLSTEQKNLHCRINAEPDPEQRKALKIERSAKLHEIRRILQKEGEQYWQRKAVEVDALRPDPRSYFNAINNLRQLRSGKKAAPVRLADADGRIMADISWNLNAFNEYYESVFYTDGQPLDLRQQSNEEDPFTIEEVRSAIIKQKSGGAVGPDGISADALKSAKNLFAPWLTNFFNAVQATEYCPDDMRCGLIVPIYKAGKPLGHPKSYRPVMLLSVVRKILTSILTRRHTLHVQSYVAESQAGFRPGRSTTDGVFYARTMCERALLGDWSYSSALLDFSGAFDTVIRQVALERLATAGAPTSTTAVLVSNTTARTKLGKQLSKPFPTNIGVVQGDPMSPIMFITYAEGSMRRIREQALPASDLPATFTQYADDTTAHQNERSSVEETVRVCEPVFSDDNLKLNVAKTQYFTVTKEDDSWKSGEAAGEYARHSRRHSSQSVCCKSGICRHSMETPQPEFQAVYVFLPDIACLAV